MRQRTGVKELDEMLCGGFLPGDAVLLEGGAGTGKTTLALQHLVNGATQFGESGIYLTFEQLPNQIYRDCQALGWDIRRIEDEDKFRLICTSPNILLEDGGGETILLAPVKDNIALRMVV